MEEVDKKVEELINKFYPRATSYAHDRKNQIENAKECVLILVHEILTNDSLIKTSWDIDFWNKVKIKTENYEL